MAASNPSPLELVDILNEQLDALSDSLSPLLQSGLPDTATKLPVADKARLYVLATYSIEALLFAHLRLQGTDTREHAVMRELARVRQYVAKIKDAQEAAPRAMELDKAAAGRFIQAALAGNDKYDAERAERQEREKAGAQVKLEELEQKVLEGKKKINDLNVSRGRTHPLEPRNIEREPESEEEALKIIDEEEDAAVEGAPVEEKKSSADGETGSKKGKKEKKKRKKEGETKQERKERKDRKAAKKAKKSAD